MLVALALAGVMVKHHDSTSSHASCIFEVGYQVDCQ